MEFLWLKRFLYGACYLCYLLNILYLSVYHCTLQVRNALGIGHTEGFAVHKAQHAYDRPCAYIKCKNRISLWFQRLLADADGFFAVVFFAVADLAVVFLFSLVFFAADSSFLGLPLLLGAGILFTPFH